MNWQISYVEPILFIYMFCLFLSYPVEQQMVYQKVCLSHFNQKYCNEIDLASNDTKKKYNENLVQSETAQWDMYISICKTLPAVFSTLVFGAWSDGTGRKKLLMFPIFGEAISSICYLLNAWYISTPVHYLLIGNLVSGVFGNFATILMSVFAYIADISKDSLRSKRVTILDSMVFLGSCASYLLGGVILEKFGFAAVYGLLVCLYVVLIIYLFFLKESYHPAEKLSMMDLFFKGKIVGILKLLSSKRRDSYRVTLVLLFCSFFFLILLFSGINGITVLYLRHEPLNFSPSKIGYFFAEINGIRFIGSTMINLILIQKYKWNDYSIILITSVIYGAFTVSLGLSNKEWQIFLAPLWCLGIGAGVAATRAGLSKMVSSTEQGKMFSIAASVEVISSLAAGVICNTIYKHTVNISQSFTFYLMAGLSSIPFLFSILLKFYGDKPRYVEIEQGDVYYESQND